MILGDEVAFALGAGQCSLCARTREGCDAAVVFGEGDDDTVVNEQVIDSVLLRGGESGGRERGRRGPLQGERALSTTSHLTTFVASSSRDAKPPQPRQIHSSHASTVTRIFT
jgi:hypothetical protein